MTELIGNTPCVRFDEPGAFATIVLKLESFNPGGSAKDRVALNMIKAAEKAGKLKRGATVIEPTSGNTGVGLAWISAVLGYKTILTMPETMSIERRRLLAAYGAEIVLTPATEGMKGAIDKALELQAGIEGSFIPDQFSNPANPKAHETSTGPEIWEQTGGNVDIYVATVGTGGTFSGTARYLKSRNPHIIAVAVEPEKQPHKIQGIGANFTPENYDLSLVDETIKVSDEDAYFCTGYLARHGILSGISSGAAFCAARKLAMREENAGKSIVVVLPDTGERYLSTGVFEL